MAKRIENINIANPNAFDNFIEGIVNAQEQSKKLEADLKAVSEIANKELKSFSIGKSEDLEKLDRLITDLVSSVETLTSAQKQRAKVESGLTREQAAIIKLEKERRQSVEENRIALQRLRVEKSQQNKLDKRTAVQTSEVTTEYQKQSARLQTLRDSVKDAILNGEDLTDEFKLQQKELQELDARLKNVDASVGQFQRNVGNYLIVARETGRVTELLSRSFAEQTGVLKDLEKEYKDLVASGKENTEQAENLSKAIIELRDNSEKTNESLKQLNQTTVQGAIDAKKAADEAAKTGRATELLTDSFDNQALVLRELEKRFRDLSAAGKGQTEESEKIGKAILELRSSSEKANRSLKDLGKTTSKIEGDARNAAEGVERLQSQLDNLKGGAIAVGAVLAGGGILGKALKSSQDGFDDFEAAAAGLGTGVDAFLSGVVKSVGAFGDAFVQERGSFFGFTERLEQGFSAFGKTLVESTVQATNAGFAIKELTKEQQKLIDQLAGSGDVAASGLLEELADLNKTFEEQSALADQDTRSLEQREKAARDVIKTTTDLFAKEKQIANAQINLSRRRVEILEKNGLKSRQAQLDLAESEVALTEIQTREAQARIQNTDRLLGIRSDQAELDLDILIDAFDNQKAINERIIADDRFTVEERRKLLEQTKELAEASQKESAKTLQKQLDDQNELNEITGKRINVQEELNKIEGQTSVQQVESIKNLGLTEKLQTRFLEILREKRTAEQDLLESTRDLNMAEEERDLRTANIVDQFQALNEAKEKGADLDQIQVDLDNRLRENRVKQLKFLIDEKDLREEIAKKESTIMILKSKQLEVGNELTEKELQLTIDRLQSEVNVLTKRNEDVSELQEELNDLLLEGAEETQKSFNDIIKASGEIAVEQLDVIEQNLGILFERINNQTNSEIQSAESNIERLRTLANQQSEDSENNLAFEQKRLAELELRKARELRKQQNLELGVAAFKAYAENAGEPGAVGKTLRDLAVLAAGVAAINLPTNFHGTDDTGQGGNVDSKRGFLSILHPQEQVWSKANRKEVGMKTRREIIDIVKTHDSKMNQFDVMHEHVHQAPSTSEQSDKYLKQIGSKLDEVVAKIPEINLHYNDRKKEWVEERKTAKRRERNHHKTGGLYG